MRLHESRSSPEHELDGRTTTVLDVSSPVSIETAELVVPIGTTLGDHYRVLDVLGSGGMGIVLRALDEDLQREVAIKLIHSGGLAGEDRRVRFRAEARALARVRHVNVVDVFAYGEHDDVPYFVMEYVPGSNLGVWMRRHGRLEPADLVSILDQICLGVSAIHEAGTLHRDLKPSNVLVGPRSRVAVTDLGLAQLVGRTEDPVLGAMVGTPAYLAPELAREEIVSPELAHRVDVYSLGCMAFELLTGRLPFPARALAAMLIDHAHAPPPIPSQVAPGVSPAFDEPLLRALSKDPEERTPDVEAFRREMLAAVSRGEPGERAFDVLVVDDDPMSLRAMRALLEDVFVSASVRCASDGVSAMEMAQERSPSIVITDLDMPNRGGLELTARLRACTKTADVPIIVITGQGGASDWRALHALGADRFLVKPIVPDTLINELRGFMERAPVSGG